MAKPLRVFLVCDLPERTETPHDVALILNDDRPTERDVYKALRKLGFEVMICGVFDDLTVVERALFLFQPDVIFNLCETFAGDRSHEGSLAAYFQLTGIPVTGSKADALFLCKNKVVAKQVAAHEGVNVPRFIVSDGTLPEKDHITKIIPAIVKPVDREASEGISQASLVHDYVSCCERVDYITSKFRTKALVEEFIHGREVYVGLIETTDGLVSLPIRELVMRRLPDDKAMVATYKAKWDEEYRAKWGITTVKVQSISEQQTKYLIDNSKKIFRALGLSGYARIDWRLRDDAEAFFLEANPNPALATDDEVAKAAKTMGLSYQELILKIVSFAIHQGQVGGRRLIAAK